MEALAPTALPPFSALDRTRQAAPQVFERLRALIVRLDLAPGTVLGRAELAAKFGISQTPVRDALIKLSEEGLVDIFPQHATLVSRIDLASTQEVHFMRRAIELEVVGTLAAQPTDLLLAQLRAQMAVQQALAAAENYGDFILADQEFHRLMYAAAGVGTLFDLVRRMSGHVDRLRRLHLPAAGKMQAVLRDHRRIADAIAAGDAALARHQVREHLGGTLDQVEALKARHPDWFT